MGRLYDEVADGVAILRRQYREAAHDGMTVREALQLVARFGGAVVRLVHAVPGATVEEREAAVLAAVDEFYAQVIAPLDLPGVPNVVEGAIVDPSLGSALHYAVAALLGFVVEIMDEAGLLPKPPAPETTA